jgi:hypothetical protein
MATEFVTPEHCIAVGDVPAAIEASGEFTSEEVGEPRSLGGSEGFLYPKKDGDGVVCSHLMQGPAGEVSGEPVTVSMHKLDTSAENLNDERTHHLFSHGLELHIGDGASDSPSPSPLSESPFEPYVICTKNRSETSCSNESQYSSSSEDHPESWFRNKDDRSYEDRAIPCVSLDDQRCFGQGGERLRTLISANHDASQVLCKTKPVLPPTEGRMDDPPSSPLFFPSINPPPPPPTTPPPSSAQTSNSGLNASLCVQRTRAFTFHDCMAGKEEGKFSADYMGKKEVDMYIKSTNSVAKELTMNQRPKEVQVFVTSERVRLAPPNSPTLFLSFMVKDILLLRRCSKNKRIIGVMVWKLKVGMPSCHILRCKDNLVADALYHSMWKQTQKVDDVPFSKVWEKIK